MEVYMVLYALRTSGGSWVAGSRSERVSRPRGSALALPVAPGGCREGGRKTQKPDFRKSTKNPSFRRLYVVRILSPTSDLGSGEVEFLLN